MSRNLPLLLAITGTLLNVLSIILSSYIVTQKEKRRISVESDLADLQRQLSYMRETKADADYRLTFGQLLLAIIGLAQNANHDIAAHYTSEAINYIRQGIVQRYSAATGQHPTELQVKEWYELGEKAKAGEYEAMPQLSKVSQGLNDLWVDRNNALVKKIADLRSQKASLDRNIENIRHISIAFQIIGLIIVLLKDFFK